MNDAHVTAVPPGPAGARPIAADEAWSTRTGLASAGGPDAFGSPRVAGDTLITIVGIRVIFGLGRTAAYELTRRPGFPDPVRVSARCYRWWASEVDAFAAALRRERAQPAAWRTARPALPDPGTAPRRITGNIRAARASRKRTS